MGTKTRKNTRAGKARGLDKTERPPSPVERLAIVLRLFNEKAFAAPKSPLVYGGTPQDVLKNCRELLEWLHVLARTSESPFERGSQHVYLMLSEALECVERDLKELLKLSADIASKVKP